MTTGNAADFMATAKANVPGPANSNSEWGGQYAVELRRIVTEQAARAPRSVQQHLGPSELGAVCDRQVVWKMAGLPTTNHVSDPWPSIMGTAGHLWMDRTFQDVDARLFAETGHHRFLPEARVFPDEEHPGTCDLYDARLEAVVDHKFLGDSSMVKLRNHGPGPNYWFQLLLYGRGYRRLGLPVKHVAIAAWPRTGSSLSGLYVWTHTITPDDDLAVDQLLAKTALRHQVAREVAAGRLNIMSVPATPEDSACYFCDAYRPQSAYDGGVGCPGGRLPKGDMANG
jgi:hypothetical protein